MDGRPAVCVPNGVSNIEKGDMTAMKNRIKVQIGGTEYILSSEESEAYVQELANTLDQSIRGMMNTDPRVSLTMAAVLNALTAADEARKAAQSADHLRAQIQDYLTDNARMRAEADDARREAEQLRREIEDLHRRLGDRAQ